MLTIFETEDFTVKAPDKPHHSRANGGHIIMAPKHSAAHLYELEPGVAKDMTILSMLVSEAATKVLRGQGIDIVRVNYQDNGNWAYKKAKPTPYVHLHLYFRSRNEKHPDNDPRFQPFPDALTLPPYESGYFDKFEPLTEEDCRLIKDECLRMHRSKYDYFDLKLI